jgi:3-oxoacyl-[acyl-carrier-protein] synthase-1
MLPVYVIGSNIVSALGMDVAAHWEAVTAGRIGISRYEDHSLSNVPFMASRPSPAQWQAIASPSDSTPPSPPFQQLAAYSLAKALDGLNAPINLVQTAFILATTKGDIELMDKVPDEQLSLHYSARQIAKSVGIGGKVFVLSQACASGVVALQYGLRLLQSGRYKHVVVTGCDRFSRFVLNGFQSFQAISPMACRPFDAARDGITLGEAAATIILSVNRADDTCAQLVSGATSNDANHISGPSRTGEELAGAITRALAEASITPAQVGMISAHGTATIYNDEMEARAFTVAGLAQCPVHSFKGYVGHTLGAAGILESIMAIEGMRAQTLIPSPGFEHAGTPNIINVTRTIQFSKMDYILKTASGFGGCNAVAVWKKV